MTSLHNINTRAEVYVEPESYTLFGVERVQGIHQEDVVAPLDRQLLIKSLKPHVRERKRNWTG